MTNLPDKITAGFTLNFLASLADYPASEWTLKFRLVPRTTGDPIDFTATAEGDDHRVTTSGATWEAGFFSATSYVVNIADSDISYPVETTQVEIVANPLQTDGNLDTRSNAKKIVDAIDAAIVGRATVDQMEYEIAIGGNSRRVKYCTRTELIQIRDYYAAIVARENAAARRAAGLADQSQSYVRFNRV